MQKSTNAIMISVHDLHVLSLVDLVVTILCLVQDRVAQVDLN